MTDAFTSYEMGLTRLLERMGKEHPRYAESLTLQTRLLENIAQVRNYSDSENLRSERNRILAQLNRLALEATEVNFNELCKEEEPPELPRARPQKLFPGLHPYGIDDTDVFFGRDKETESLITQIKQDPIVVINGLSGCGKSSLIKAGVMPRLQESKYQVIYASVFENIIEDVLREIRRALDAGEVPYDYVDALQRLYRKQPGQSIVLIVDQFEQALSASHDSQALERFLRGIPRLVSDVRPFAKVIIVLRADWLYFLQASAREFYPRLNVYSCIFTLDPLTKRAAREVIVRPLQTREVTYDEEVIDEIVNRLQTSFVGPSVGPYIHPVQLQIVLRALFDLAEQRQAPEQALTKEIYRQSGGVESVLRNHLANSLGRRPEAWRLLARFIAPGGKTGRTIRQSELLAVPAAQDVRLEIRFLINQGFLDVYEAEDIEETFYRISHDYLVGAIVDYLNQNPDQQGWKLAEDWLSSGTLEWRESTQRDRREDFLLEKNRYLHIYQYRDKLRLTDEAQRLLVLTVLRYGHEGLGYWLSRGSDADADVQIVANRLLSTDPEVRKAARKALAGCVRPSYDTVTPLDEERSRLLREWLRQAMESPADSSERDAAAQALWVLRAFDTPAERLRVGGFVFRRWVRDHSLQITSYLLTAFFVLALIVGGLYVREKLRGSWQIIRSLKAGNTPLVVTDPRDPETLYALTMGGPGPREGSSLFIQRGDEWELRSRDFSKGEPTSIIVVHNDIGSSLYATMYGVGVMRSEDGGQTWELVNRGLPSHGLTSLVADPDYPSTLYVATNDWRGVLRSSDGGESWDFYDYRGEIFGTPILELAYTRANGGALIAGTEDGRILMHRRDSSDWELSFGLSKGSIKALVVSRANEEYIYAGTSRGIVLRSQNGGESWEVLGQPSNEFNITAIAVAPDNPGRLYVSAYGNGGYKIWESQDMGQSWEMVPSIGLPRTWIGSLVVVGREPYRLVAGTADGLFASRDGGANWEKEPLAAPLAHIKTVALSARYSTPVYAAVGGSIYVNDGSIYANPKDDHQWVHSKGLQAGTVRTVVVDPENPRIAYAGVLLLGEWSVFSTRDGGQTWQRTTPPCIEPVVPDTMALTLAKDQDGKTIVYAGTVGCGVFRSEDEGKSWETFGRARCDQVIENMPSDVSFLTVDAGDSDVVYAAAGQQVYRSENGGFSWQQYESEIDSPIMGMVADPLESSTVYLITGSDGFWYSEDGGETWQRRGDRQFEGVELRAITAVPNRAGHLVVGSSSGGIWITSDRGKNWRFIRENLAIGHITSIATSEELEGKFLIGSLSDGIALFTPGQLFSNTR